MCPSIFGGCPYSATAVDTNTLEHFDEVYIPVAQDRRRVDVLINPSDKSLLTVLEKREGTDAEELNNVLTRLGPIVSRRRVCGDLWLCTRAVNRPTSSGANPKTKLKPKSCAKNKTESQIRSKKFSNVAKLF